MPQLYIRTKDGKGFLGVGVQRRQDVDFETQEQHPMHHSCHTVCCRVSDVKSDSKISLKI